MEAWYHPSKLVALGPDLIVANAPPSVLAVQQASRTVPIVFAAVTDPVAMGIVESLARPGGNATGFMSAEFGMSAKWLELLKEIAPGVKRVAVFLGTEQSGGGAAIRCDPDRRGFVRGGTDPAQRPRRRRDRAFSRSIRARRTWRSDRNQDCGGDRQARSDHSTGRPASAARGLSFALLRHRRRSDLLRVRHCRPVPARRRL